MSTVSLLIFLNGGYLFCCIPFWFSGGGPESPKLLLLSVAGVTPVVEAISLFSLFDILHNQPHESELISGWVFACLGSILGYGVAALLLKVEAVGTFEKVADRPRRPPRGPSADRALPAEPVESEESPETHETGEEPESSSSVSEDESSA